VGGLEQDIGRKVAHEHPHAPDGGNTQRGQGDLIQKIATIGASLSGASSIAAGGF